MKFKSTNSYRNIIIKFAAIRQQEVNDKREINTAKQWRMYLRVY